MLFLAVPFSVVPLKPHTVILTVCCSWRYLRKFVILMQLEFLEIMASNSSLPNHYENRKKSQVTKSEKKRVEGKVMRLMDKNFSTDETDS